MPTSSLLVKFGERIYKERTQKKISQADLAEQAGLHQHAISEIERGKRDLRLTTVYRLAEALNLEAGDLL